MDPNQTFESGNMSRSSTPLNGNPPDYQNEGTSFSPGPQNHSIGRVMQDLIRDMTVLIERQGQLLRVELSEKATIIKASGASMASAVALILFGVQALVAAAVIGLAYVMDWWLAAALVGVALLVIGGVMAIKAKKALNFENLKPTKSADALNDIGVKLKEKAHEFYH